jgi:hypothetical protein
MVNSVFFVKKIKESAGTHILLIFYLKKIIYSVLNINLIHCI